MTEPDKRFNFCQAATLQMMSQRYGRIINMSSVAMDVSNPGQANYAASKGGVEGFTRCVATELLRVAVLPQMPSHLGFIETDMTVAVVNLAGDEIKKKIPVRRLGDLMISPMPCCSLPLTKCVLCDRSGLEGGRRTDVGWLVTMNF